LSKAADWSNEMTMTDYARIRDSLRRLRDSNIASQVFGAESHGFAVNPPLTEDDVRAFESRHVIVLPGDYRGFLIHVGDGGAGPAYGVLRLGEADAAVGTLSRPFPHTEEWNDLSGKPEYDSSKENDEAYWDEYHERLNAWRESHYWNPAHVDGAIRICDLGCALTQLLVVTGPEAGHIWDDGLADEAGLIPVESDEGERVTFLQWYFDWLNDALRKLK